jgi:hypothetical protein
VLAIVGQKGLSALGGDYQQEVDLLGAGIAKALLGKAAVPDDLPYVTGSIGLLGTRPSYDMMMDCDTLLMIGSRFPYSEFLPKEGQARGSRCKNTPFDEARMEGKVKLIMVAGEIVFEAEWGGGLCRALVRNWKGPKEAGRPYCARRNMHGACSQCVVELVDKSKCAQNASRQWSPIAMGAQCTEERVLAVVVKVAT